MREDKEIKEKLSLIKEVTQTSAYDPLYFAGIARALKWFLEKEENLFEVSANENMICPYCKTDLARIIEEHDVKICLQCKKFWPVEDIKK